MADTPNQITTLSLLLAGLGLGFAQGPLGGWALGLGAEVGD